MLATLLTAFLIAQDPMAVMASHASGPRDAMQIEGRVELDPTSALLSAKEAVAERAQRQWEERAARLAAQQMPDFVPDIFVQQAVRRFLQRQPVEQTFQVVDRRDSEREHEFGKSWQTTLWVAEDLRATAACERHLLAELRRAERMLLWKSGGTVVLWALLGLALGWVDRLSRGYMTGRLRCLGLLLGTGVPAIAFLL